VIDHEYTHHFLGNNLHNIPADFSRAGDFVENILTRMNDPEAVERARDRIRMTEDRRAAPQRPVEPPTAGPESARGTADAPVDDALPPLPGYPTPKADAGAETVAARQRQLAAYDQAVARANLGDLKGAVGILEGLQKEVKDADLRDQITTLTRPVGRNSRSLGPTRPPETPDSTRGGDQDRDACRALEIAALTPFVSRIFLIRAFSVGFSCRMYPM